MSLAKEIRDVMAAMEAGAQQMATTARRMAELQQQLGELLALVDGPTPEPQPAPPRPLPLPRPPVPAPPPPAPPERQPEFRSGYIDPLVWAEIQRAAPTVGVEPETLAAVQIWESSWWTSELFLDEEGWNVGGIKDTEYSRKLPGYAGPSESGTYATFTDWRSGIWAHAMFLGQKRYDGIRDTDDPVAEVKVIHEAGYAEHSESWLEGVTAVVRQLAKQHPRPMPPDAPGRIAAAALALPDPFPYRPETEGGELGCANVVSHALIDADVIDTVEVSVAGLAKRLKAIGFVKVEEPYRSGDVVVWGKRPGGAHKHVGILLVELGGEVITVQNSSSKRKVVRLPLKGYDRPTEEVLRAP